MKLVYVHHLTNRTLYWQESSETIRIYDMIYSDLLQYCEQGDTLLFLFSFKYWKTVPV